MLITTEQETLLLLLLAQDVALEHPLMGPLRELRRELRQRCITRSQINELARSAAK